MKNQIETFMKCTGNDNPSFDDIDNEYLFNKVKSLLPLLQEEVKELAEAVCNMDVVEAVDAIGDMGVYYYQLVLLLERAGIDYKSACQAICTNNSLKYTTSAGLAERWLNEWQCEGNFDYYVSGTEVDEQMYYCLKDIKTKKVKKWKRFTQVSLKEFIPEKYLNE